MYAPRMRENDETLGGWVAYFQAVPGSHLLTVGLEGPPEDYGEPGLRPQPLNTAVTKSTFDGKPVTGPQLLTALATNAPVWVTLHFKERYADWAEEAAFERRERGE